MNNALNPNMKTTLKDIILIISWREMARQYFGKSASWLYHKLDGIDGNGGKGEFSEEEKEILRNALRDLSSRLITASNNI